MLVKMVALLIGAGVSAVLSPEPQGGGCPDCTFQVPGNANGDLDLANPDGCKVRFHFAGVGGKCVADGSNCVADTQHGCQLNVTATCTDPNGLGTCCPFVAIKDIAGNQIIWTCGGTINLPTANSGVLRCGAPAFAFVVRIGPINCNLTSVPIDSFLLTFTCNAC